MAGKPTIPITVHRQIRTLAAQGMGRKAIAAELGYSMYTVRKALDSSFPEHERQRQRTIDRSDRRKDPAYKDYQATYGASEAHKARSRETMRRIRARDKVNTNG